MTCLRKLYAEDRATCGCDECVPPKVEICTVPPEGWHCTRAAGHEGPCAAISISAFPANLIIDNESAPGAWAEAIAHTPHLAAQVLDARAVPGGVSDTRPVASQQGGPVPTDRWWAQRWIEKATPGELAAMRELLG